MTHPETKQPDSKAQAVIGESPRVDAYPFKLDAIVLSGTHENAKRLIMGRNKAFVKIGGQVLIRHVVDALIKAKSIDQIYVVGDRKSVV